MKGLLYKDISIMTRSFKGNILLLVALYGVLILVTREAYLAYAMTVVWGIYVAGPLGRLRRYPAGDAGAGHRQQISSMRGQHGHRRGAFAGVGFAGRRWWGRVRPRHSGLRRSLGADERSAHAHHLPLRGSQIPRIFNGHCVCYRFRGVFCRTGDSTKPDAGGHCRHEYRIASQNRPYSGHNCPVALV